MSTTKYAVLRWDTDDETLGPLVVGVFDNQALAQEHLTKLKDLDAGLALTVGPHADVREPGAPGAD